MYKTTFYLLVLFLALFSCKQKDMSVNEDPGEDEYVVGKNHYTMTFGGVQREYYLHVPSIYDPEDPTPVVFMLHGTSGDGERFYNISGWKEVGEVQNILTVYPSSWRYNIIDEGIPKNITKWNAYQTSWVFAPGETPRDDIGFLRAIIEELKSKFNVDSTRFYMVGFSNGGVMTGRCAIEMSNQLAAVIQASGNLPPDTTFIPARKLPIMFQVGNSDDVYVNEGNELYEYW